MAKVYPFRALRPAEGLAPRVASVPYDVVNTAEARALAADEALSFLHVIKPEIDLPDSQDPYGDAVYAGGAAALKRFIDDGTMVQDDDACFYIYRLRMGEHIQTGIVLAASVEDYDANIVRKHEFTRPDKEDDRVRHMTAMGAQTGTVFLSHRHHDGIEGAVAAVTAGAPAYDFTAVDEVQHTVWVVRDAAQIAAIQAGFEELGPVYIADGHHRSASASRVAAANGGAQSDFGRFLAVSFPVGDMQILPYNRVVKDLNGHSEAAFMEAVRGVFTVSEGKPEPIGRRQFGMYLGGTWYTLEASITPEEAADPVKRLDVSILQDKLLAPVLGIGDPRKDKRIDFVGGIRGDGELEKRVAGGAAVAFAMYRTDMEDLLDIADAGEVMPPKSTWFEPKLRDGLFVNRLPG